MWFCYYPWFLGFRHLPGNLECVSCRLRRGQLSIVPLLSLDDSICMLSKKHIGQVQVCKDSMYALLYTPCQADTQTTEGSSNIGVQLLTCSPHRAKGGCDSHRAENKPSAAACKAPGLPHTTCSAACSLCCSVFTF